MAKGPFHFKAFSVEQDGAAMKVGTDGIVLGCWTPLREARKILDVGAGNGYVGLMLLQRAHPETELVGVELEPGAAAQCTANYQNQPFPGHRTSAWQGAIQDAVEAHPEWSNHFDLILSNPPFFRDKPKSSIEARNLARHDDTMPMGALAKAAWSLLKPGGRLCTIWPMDRLDEWEQWGRGVGFQCMQEIHVQTMRHLPPKRFLSEWIKPGKEGANAVLKATGQLTLEGSATLDFTEQYLEIVHPYLRGT